MSIKQEESSEEEVAEREARLIEEAVLVKECVEERRVATEC